MTKDEFKKKYKEEGLRRMIARKQIRYWRRQARWSQRKTFQCEMGYGSCEQRGYCNGDC